MTIIVIKGGQDMKKLIITLTLVALMSIIGITALAAPKKTTEKPLNKFINLTDTQLKQAIKEGSQQKTLSIGYKIKAASNNTAAILDYYDVGDVSFLTPYQVVKLQSYQSSSKYENYTLAEARKIFDTMREHILFSVDTYGDKIDFHKDCVIVLEQNGKYIKPSDIPELDEDAQLSGRRYYRPLTCEFPTSKVDLNEPADLIVSLVPDFKTKAIYHIDFKKYK